MTRQQELQDEIMGLKAAIAGKRMELAHVRGKPVLASKRMRQMYAVVQARRDFRIAVNEASGGCFFDASGQADALPLRG